MKFFNKLYSCVPTIIDECSNQVELSDVSDEEFQKAYLPKPQPWYHTLFRVFCFFAFLGPIRIIFCFGGSILLLGIAVLFRMFLHKIGRGDSLKKETFKFEAFAFRIMALSFGIVYINKKGSIDPETRVFYSNHTAFIDPFLICYTNIVSSVMKIELSYNKITQFVYESSDPIYVDRKTAKGATKYIIDRVNDENRTPVLIYPEGTLTNGECLLKFHRGAFLTEKKVQPISVRYWQPLVPKDWNTYAWVEPNIIKHFLCLFSMPFSFVTIEYLSPIQLNKEGNGNIEEFTKYAQLLLANNLKVKAINKSSDLIFKKKKEKNE